MNHPAPLGPGALLFAEVTSGGIGASLQAEVDLALHGHRYTACESLGDDLRFVLITSKAGVAEVDAVDGESVTVQPSTAAKCGRCWHYRDDVDAEGLCGRCHSNLHGEGESRRHA